MKHLLLKVTIGLCGVTYFVIKLVLLLNTLFLDNTGKYLDSQVNDGNGRFPGLEESLDYSLMTNDSQTCLLTNYTPRLMVRTPKKAVGLGNTMFIYATEVGLAAEYCRRPVFLQGSVLYEIFQVSAETVPSWPKRWKRDHENEGFASKYDPHIPETVSRVKLDLFINGYLQSWKYFHKHSNIIRKEFTFKDEIWFKVQNFLHQSLINTFGKKYNITQIKIIGVHVRIGDLASDISRDRGYTPASSEYLQKAAKYYQQQFSSSQILFIVASDSIDKARREFNESTTGSAPVVYSTLENAADDLALLASCDHLIMTVGTYGWWAAYLAGGQVVYTKDFPLPDTPLWNEFNPDDVYLPEWVGI